MSVLKPCVILTHNDVALKDAVVALAKEVGFIHNEGHVRDSYVVACGNWDNRYRPTTFFTSTYNSNSSWCNNPQGSWPRFDARTQMEALKEYWGLIEYDETPLPQVMNEEQAAQVKRKFALSDDQWDAIPPLAREALAGAPVTIVKSGDLKWVPLSQPNPESNTVVVTLNPASGSAQDCGLGFFMGGDYMRVYGVEHPTHWAVIPPVIEEEEEYDSEDEE